MSQNTAIVVGVGAELGLGAALCRRFAAEDYHMLIGGRTPEKIEQVARAIVASGGSAEAVQTDATSEADVIRLFDKAFSPSEQRNPPDLIVFNAGNIDGGIGGERLRKAWPQMFRERGEDGFLDVGAIAEAYWQIHRLHRSAWTQEFELRPFKENF